jgi:hypothetical protein
MRYVVLFVLRVKDTEADVMLRVTGFDLIGHEDVPFNLEYCHEELLTMKATCEALGIHIPFMFHAGETLLDSGSTIDPAKSNLDDAILMRAKRIANGFALVRHTALYSKSNTCESALTLPLLAMKSYASVETSKNILI